MNGGAEEFREILKERARGPGNLGPLDPALCERAMRMILAGQATPAQTSGFLLVGRAVGDSPPEMAAYTRAARTLVRPVTIDNPSRVPLVSVAGSFDGKLRTFNTGALAALVAAAAGGRVLMFGGEGVPPKEGRTVFDALRNLGVQPPRSAGEVGEMMARSRLAATTAVHYLPELHALLKLRREMVRRTALNVVEKLVPPVPGSPLMLGVTHRSFLNLIPESLSTLEGGRALVYQAIEGSDEAPLDQNSTLVRVEGGVIREFRVAPAQVGLRPATKSDVPWNGPEDEAHRLEATLGGERGPVRDLILYNAGLRLLVAGAESEIRSAVDRARSALDSGAAGSLLEKLRTPGEAPVDDSRIRDGGLLVNGE